MSDALLYSFVGSELDKMLGGGRIDKISMPNAYDIILKIRNGKQNFDLLISSLPMQPRMHITTSPYENPLKSPSFLMHLRKHIGGAIIENVCTIKYERVICLKLLSREEFEYKHYELYVELTGKYSNIVLVCNETVSDCLKHITPDVSSKRIVLPGAKYKGVPKQEKLTPDDDSIASMLDEYKGDRIESYLQSIMCGSPSSIKEAVARAKTANGINTDGASILNEVRRMYVEKDPCLIIKDGRYVEFLTSPYITKPGEIKKFPTVNQCLDEFYRQTASAETGNAQLKRLHSILKNAIKRANKKLDDLRLRLNDCLDYENDLICGELITANMYMIPQKSKGVTVLNYYTGEQQKIKLDENLTAAENAQAYFKSYAKKKNSLQKTQQQIDETVENLSKYDDASESFDLSKTRADIADIELELRALHLLERKPQKAKQEKSSPLSVTYKGAKIEIGKNNVQNDRLWKSAVGKDIWLHVKDNRGSHCIVRGSDNEEVILIAARLAAYYSKARYSDKVAVDYTYAKFVKQIHGGGFGKVTYTNQKTLFVKPLSLEELKSYDEI